MKEKIKIELEKYTKMSQNIYNENEIKDLSNYRCLLLCFVINYVQLFYNLH